MNMEKIIELLKQVRIEEHGRRWLVWFSGEWHVLEREYYARKNTVLYVGEDLEKALTVLVNDED